MNNVVRKYTLPAADVVEISLPVGAEFLNVGAYGNNACLWARVDPAEHLETRRLIVVETDCQDAAYGTYLGTACVRGYDVQKDFHVFDFGPCVALGGPTITFVS